MSATAGEHSKIPAVSDAMKRHTSERRAETDGSAAHINLKMVDSSSSSAEENMFEHRAAIDAEDEEP